MHEQHVTKPRAIKHPHDRCYLVTLLLQISVKKSLLKKEIGHDAVAFCKT